MAAVHSYGTAFDSSLEDLPSWKKDLILRKRANARTYGISPARGSGGGNIASQGGSSTTDPNPNFARSQPGSISKSSCSREGPRGGQHPMTSRRTIGSQQEIFSSSSVQDFEASGSHEKNCACESSDSVNGGNCATKSSEMHHKGRFNKSNRIFSTTSPVKNPSALQEESGELEYGPGIVSRLKDRYLSLAMRESRARASLRKYSSLEDLLDEAPAWQERGRSTAKARGAVAGTPPVRREIMKRTRSMDSLAFRRAEPVECKMPKSHSSGGIRQAPFDAIAKDVIIVEKTLKEVSRSPKGESEILSRKTSLVEEEEMPAPDTVKQVKQIFESAPSIKSSSRGTAAKVAAYKASQASKKGVKPSGPKPAIKAKPKFLNSTVEEARSSLKQVALVGRSSPRSTLSVKAVALQNGSINSSSPPILPGLTPVSSSVTAPLVNGDHKLNPDEVESKKVFTTAIPNLSRDIDITDDSNIHKTSQARLSRPLSPVPANLPPSPTFTHKVNITQTFQENCDNMKENHKILQENKKNTEKSNNAKPFKEIHCNAKTESSLSSDECPSPEILEKLISPLSYSESRTVPSENVKPTQDKEEYIIRSPQTEDDLRSTSIPFSQPSTGVKPAKGKERWHQQENNTLVFNFAQRAETPDYIENDGVDLSKRRHMHETSGYVIMPGYDGRQDSSTDFDDPEDESFDGKVATPSLSPPYPCNIAFVGEGVIINGRSNLQRQPKPKKHEISFNMVATKIFEYPSEDSHFEIYENENKSYSMSPENNSHSTGFASYTPSKLFLSDTFELGVSRSTVVHPPTPPRERAPYSDEELLQHEHIRPASESETITWSAESVPDLLF